MCTYKIISCASFGASGSGVVTDYLREFSRIKNLGDYEFRFLQDYDGVATLEDALIHSPHRLNSDIAIQNFKRYVDKQSGTFLNRKYESYFNGKWKKISYDFIKKIVDIEWSGYWEQYQIMEQNTFYAFLKYQLYPRLLRALGGNKKYIAHYLPTRPMFFAAPSEESYLKSVKEYTRELCAAVDPERRFEYLFFDQLMPPANLSKYERYFDSIKTIVVDRDPRDYYLDNVLRWGEKWIPRSLEEFAILFRKQREQVSQFKDSENVLRIKFEDAIFNYSTFEKNIQVFLQLTPDDHIRPKMFFNPDVSAKNTQLWLKREGTNDIAKKIEKLLPEFLYDFKSF